MLCRLVGGGIVQHDQAVDGDADLVFDADFAAKWQRALDLLGRGLPGGKFDPASFSSQSGRA